MRAITLILIVVSNLVVGINNQIKIIYNIVNPAEFISKLQNEEAWFAYQVKAQTNTKSMCCWQGADSEISQCNLDSEKHSFGNRGEGLITEHINIYVSVAKGQVKKMISVGDQCEVLANGHEINWLNDVTQESSIKWLKKLSFDQKTHTASTALYTLALHQGKKASRALFDIAVMNNDINSENAVFWLGEARNDGVSHLQKLYKKLPKGQVKQHINFALSQAQSLQGIAVLKEIAKKDQDSEQRADALFWLAQKNVKGVVQILMDAVKIDPSQAVKEKALFSLSQVKSEAASDALFTLLKGDYSSQVKKQALFWLSQSDNTDTIDRLQNLL